MIDAEAVVQQVWQQIVPTNWKIIRGRRRSAFARGVNAVVWAVISLALLAGAALALNVWRHASQAGRSTPTLADALAVASASLFGYPAVAVVAVAVAALSLLTGIVVLITVAARNAGDPTPLIVLLPEGFVEYANRHKPIVGIAYADLASADFNRRATGRSRAAWLELVYHNGGRERWRPRADFGSPQRLFEAISKARALYEVLYGEP